MIGQLISKTQNLTGNITPFSFHAAALDCPHFCPPNTSMSFFSVTAQQVAELAAKQGGGASQSGQIAIVTGASSGIGKESARVLAMQGLRVIMACRDVAKGELAVKSMGHLSPGSCEVMQLDTSSFQSTQDFANAFLALNCKLHVLMLNAGVCPTWFSLTKDGYQETFQVNYLSHYLLTRLLEAKLVESAPSRVVLVSSKLYYLVNMDFPSSPERKGFRSDSAWEFGPLSCYGMSKLAMLLFGKSLSQRLKDKNVSVFAVHPGAVDTKIYPIWLKPFAFFLFASVGRGAATQVHVALSPKLTGKEFQYWEPRAFRMPGPVRLWSIATNNSTATRLWDSSEKIVRNSLF